MHIMDHHAFDDVPVRDLEDMAPVDAVGVPDASHDKLHHHDRHLDL